MTKYIALAHTKGGVGKSTLAVHIGVGLAKKNSVLMIDADSPQDTVASWGTAFAEANPKNKKLVFQKALTPATLGELAEQANGVYDYVIIDLPPRDQAFINRALAFTDLAIIPLKANATEAWATQDTLKLIEAQLKTNPDLTFKLLWNQYTPSRASEEFRQAALQELDITDIGCTIPRRNSFELGFGTSAWDSKNDKAIAELNALLHHIKKIIVK